MEGESKEQNLIKQLTFGKLPECLCLHIQRTGNNHYNTVQFSTV